MKMRMLCRGVIALLFFIPGINNRLVAKTLLCPQMEFLNVSLASMPYVTVRLMLSRKNVLEVLEKLQRLDQQQHAKTKTKITKDPLIENERYFVEQQVVFMIQPVNEFFSHIKEHKFLIKALLDESFKAYKDKQRIYIYRFLESQVNDIISFFKQEVRDYQSLKKLCEEFKTFWNYLNDSFTIPVKKAYTKFVKELKALNSKKVHRSIDLQKHKLLKQSVAGG